MMKRLMRAEDKIKTQNRFVTTDGKGFEEVQEAVDHQKLVDLEEWYDSNILMFDGEVVEFVKILAWMKNKGEEFLNQLKSIGK